MREHERERGAPPVRPAVLRDPAPPLVARFQALQRAAGNRAVARLAPRVLARVKWISETVTKGALEARLKAAFELAQQYQTTAPPQPAWVDSTLKNAQGYHKQLADSRAEHEARAQTAWGKLKPEVRASKEYENDITRFVAKGWPKVESTKVKGLDAQRSGWTQEYKWNAEYQNKNNDLPPLGPGQSYHEYYAEPDPAHVGPEPGKGSWGKNRILRGDDGTWWATDDHYTNFKKIVP